MIDKFIKYGFAIDYDKYELKKVFGNGKFDMIYIDTTMYDPYMLCSRATEVNVVSNIKNDRLIIRKTSGFEVAIVDIPLWRIGECLVKECDIREDGSYEYEFAFKLGEMWYRIDAVMQY